MAPNIPENAFIPVPSVNPENIGGSATFKILLVIVRFVPKDKADTTPAVA